MIPPRLVPVLGHSPREIDEGKLGALVAAGINEDQDIDFKQTRYDFGPKGTFELGKDVAAMANQVGGLIVIGVKEDEQARASKMTPVKLDDAERVRMLAAIADRVHPQIPGLDVHMVGTAAGDGTGYYVIAVPNSVSAPHWARKPDQDTPYSCYPQRQGSTTIYLSEAQVAARYRSRFQLATSQVDQLREMHRKLPVMRTDGLSVLVVGVVPAFVGYRSLTGDGEKIQTYIDEVWRPGGTGVDPKLGQYRAARRRLRSTRDGVLNVELHEDGAAIAQLAVGRKQSDGSCGIDLRALEFAAVSLISFVGGYTAWSGAAGDCAVATWLLHGSQQIGTLSGSLFEPLVFPENISYEPAETTVPVEALGGDATESGRIAYPLIRDLEQDLGVPAPVVLRQNGAFLAG